MTALFFLLPLTLLGCLDEPELPPADDATPAADEAPAEDGLAEPVGSPETAAAAWVQARYPGIPSGEDDPAVSEAYTIDCSGAPSCLVTVPEHDGRHTLSCTPGGCTESPPAAEAAPPEPAAGVSPPAPSPG